MSMGQIVAGNAQLCRWIAHGFLLQAVLIVLNDNCPLAQLPGANPRSA